MAVKPLTKKEIQKLIDDKNESVTFVEKKKTSASSRLWEHFRQVYVDNKQQQFVL